MELNEILKQAAEMGASDIHLKVGLVPVVRKFGALRPLNAQAFPLTAEQMEKLVQSALTPEEIHRLASHLELDKGMELKGVARFRVNVFRQRGSTRFWGRTATRKILKSAAPSAKSKSVQQRRARRAGSLVYRFRGTQLPDYGR